MLVALAPSCGGQSVHREEGDAGDAGERPTGTGGTPGAGGSEPQAGTASSSGGRVGSGGAAGTASLAGTSGVAGCAAQPCPEPICPDGVLVSEPCGCTHCSCENVDCSYEECPTGFVPARPEGACCDVCVAINGCDGVLCEPPVECAPGYLWQRPPGACCGACRPAEGTFGCDDIACPDLECSLGYTVGNPSNGGCCYECVPDPLYCVTNDDCMIATKRVGCCFCPEVISRRLYQEDLCWEAGDGRFPPFECGFTACDVACAPCPDTGEPWCIENQCQSAWVPPPD
ncbi:MAG TPA: hypothetical protein VGK73_14265 [Polyangiaceae bacterium]